MFPWQRNILGHYKDLQETSTYGNGSSNIGIYKKFTRDHFDKNSFTQMRVYLAVQILSMSTIQMMKEGVKNENCKYTEKDLASFKELIFHLDQTTDIMNARERNNNVKKMGKVIDTPTHCHLGELLKN